MYDHISAHTLPNIDYLIDYKMTIMDCLDHCFPSTAEKSQSSEHAAKLQFVKVMQEQYRMYFSSNGG